jgi:putative peptide zinc metalloprotease protein
MSQAKPNSTTPEIELPSHLVIRPDVVLHPQQEADHFVLEDVAQGNFYRLGNSEAAFVRNLQASSDPEAVWQKLATKDFTRIQAAMLCRWLGTSGLVIGNSTQEKIAPPAKGNLTSFFSAMYFWEIPLINPDRMIAKVTQATPWLWTWQASTIGAALFLFACTLLFGLWTEFFRSYENLFSPWRWLWMAVGWFFLKLIHETAHAATCKRYGGEVRQAGLAFILFMPIAFVDVSSSWKFASRWQRLHVTLAGVCAELFIAGLALVVWKFSGSAIIQQAAADLTLIASVSTILFNLNPLLKFDGYFAVSDATGIANLYDLGRSYARYWGARYVLGLQVNCPELPQRFSGWIKFYGLASAVWRTTVVVGLIYAAATMFEGAGVIIAVAGFVLFAVNPLLVLCKKLSKLHQNGELLPVKLAIRVGLLSAFAIGSLFLIPAEIRQTAPAIVEYAPPAVIRAPLNAFVAEIHVENGEAVTAGQSILTLRNDELQVQFSNLKKQLSQTEQLIRSSRWQGNSSRLQEAESQLAGLTLQLQETQHQVDNLVVRAPCDGRIVSRKLSSLSGTYVQKGAEIGAVGMENRKQLKISLSQSELSRKEAMINQPVRVVIPGIGALQGQVQQIDARVGVQLLDASLGADHGGRLAVSKNSEGDLVLTEPRGSATVELSPADSERLSCGQRAYARLNHVSSLGHRLVGYLWQ